MKAILHLALHLFPKSFREKYGEEIVQHLLQEGREVRKRSGFSGLLRMCCHQAADLFLSAVSERKAAWKSKGNHPAAMGQNARFALRALRKTPSVSLAAVLTLGLGLGVTSTIFGVLNAVVLHPLPYPDPESLVSVSHRAEGLNGSRFSQSAATFRTYREENRVFESFGIWSRAQMAISTEDTDPEQVEAVWMSPEIFSILGIRLHLGDPFPRVKLERGVPLPVIISYELWTRRFGGDPDAVGKSLRQENVTWTISGVMPRGFTFLDTRPAIYLPTLLPEDTSPIVGKFDYQGLARLRPGVTAEVANRDVNRMIPLSVERFAWATPSELEGMRLTADVHPLADDVVGHVRSALWVLFGAFAMVLLVAGSNAANLFLVMADRRQGEMAIRTALGASRGRIMGQVLWESLLVGLAGGGLAVFLAVGGTRLLHFLAPTNLPNLDRIVVSPAVLIFTLALATVAGLLCGVIPALACSDPGRTTVLKESGRFGTTSRSRVRARNLLAVTQVALALVLVIGSFLMTRSYLALKAVDPGFGAPEELLTFSVTVPVLDHYLDADATIEFMAALSDGARALPGVGTVSAVSHLPVENLASERSVWVEGATVDPTRPPPAQRYKMALPEYFRTMGIPVVAGRDLSWQDILDRQPVALVTLGFAETHWETAEGALGRTLRMDPSDEPHRIVGVVGNVHDAGLQEPAPSIIYIPMAVRSLAGISDWVRRSMTFVVRTPDARPSLVLPGIRTLVSSLKPGVPVADVQGMEEILARDMARTTFTLVLLGLAAGVAILLGAVGIYGVVAYVFERRTRELGIRMALGADGLTVGRLVLGHAAALAGLGLAVGLPSSLVLGRLLKSLLFGVAPLDPTTYLAASGAVVLTVLLASLAPARKATSVDILGAIRQE